MLNAPDILGNIHQLRRYARLLCHDPDTADDLVQATLERAIRKASKFNEGADLRIWLFAILHNVYRSHARESLGRRAREAAWVEAVPPEVEGGQEVSADLSATLAAISSLPTEQKQVVLLVAVEGFSTDEIACALDLPLGTVRSRLARGRETLRRKLDRGAEVGRLRVIGG